ncbi:MAG: response regulator [Ignavibacteriales bacterium]|nr:response regulator [Ignavibacteriales bacterium]
MAVENKTSRRILLVDDEVGFAELLRDLLSMDNYTVEVANDGQEGLEKVEIFKPDIIISDVVMPRMSGFEMFKKVKSNSATANIPFLFITGFQDDRVLAEARKIGIFGILRKPIDVEQIELRLEDLLSKRL